MLHYTIPAFKIVYMARILLEESVLIGVLQLSALWMMGAVPGLDAYVLTVFLLILQCC